MTGGARARGGGGFVRGLESGHARTVFCVERDSRVQHIYDNTYILCAAVNMFDPDMTADTV